MKKHPRHAFSTVHLCTCVALQGVGSENEPRAHVAEIATEKMELRLDWLANQQERGASALGFAHRPKWQSRCRDHCHRAILDPNDSRVHRCDHEQPSPVRIAFTSVTHLRFGAAAVNVRASTLGAMRLVVRESVVHLNDRFLRAKRLESCMIRAIRFRPTRRPPETSSMRTRGLP